MSRRLERPQVPGDLRFEVRLRTRWVDEDNQGVLNNAVYLTLLEEARLAYFRRLELMDGASFPFLLAQCNVRFVAPGRGGADVDVAMSTVELGRTSFTQAYRVSDADGTTWLEAEALLVCWDNGERAKTEMAPRFRERVAAFEGLGGN
ncbi:MAG: acyl-CoA thioesterase [Planctomycetota bacterium]